MSAKSTHWVLHSLAPQLFALSAHCKGGEGGQGGAPRSGHAGGEGKAKGRPRRQRRRIPERRSLNLPARTVGLLSASKGFKRAKMQLWAPPKASKARVVGQRRRSAACHPRQPAHLLQVLLVVRVRNQGQAGPLLGHRAGDGSSDASGGTGQQHLLAGKQGHGWWRAGGWWWRQGKTGTMTRLGWQAPICETGADVAVCILRFASCFS